MEIALSSDQRTIIGILGNPLKVTQEAGMTVLWYRSESPYEADLYYLQSGVSVAHSLYVPEKTVSLTQYIERFGAPQASFKRFDRTVQDSLRQIVHLWPSSGVNVTTVGSRSDSYVVREERFSSMTLEEYFAGVGTYVAGNEQVVIIQVSPVTSQASVSAQQSFGGFLIPGVLAVIVLLVVFARWRRSERPQQSDQQP